LVFGFPSPKPELEIFVEVISCRITLKKRRQGSKMGEGGERK
jgi:hypothetical protein